uniref:Uncharacterized protein n=1 Tax=Manihot esculenta TaxID=3983 RepID=A0A2C9W2V4_MANES
MVYPFPSYFFLLGLVILISFYCFCQLGQGKLCSPHLWGLYISLVFYIFYMLKGELSFDLSYFCVHLEVSVPCMCFLLQVVLLSPSSEFM